MKPILFCDFDGTICHDLYWRSLPAEQYKKVQQLLFQGDTMRVNDWMRGKYTAEEINRFVAKEIGMSYEELWSVFENDCKTAHVSEVTLQKLSALRDRYIVLLITGNMDSFSRFTVPALQLEQYFDHISNSYYEEKHKADNDGELFVEYAEKWGVPISDCVVIDDSPRVCAIFEALGGRVCRITPERDIDFHLATPSFSVLTKD